MEDPRNFNKATALAYRQWFDQNVRSNVPPFLFPLFNFGVLFSAVFVAFFQIGKWQPLFILVSLIFLILGNLVVFLIHKYPLHKNWGPSDFPYEQHTLSHHKYYVNDFITFESYKELDAIFFPWFIVLGFLALVCPFFYLVGFLLFDSNMGYYFVANASAYFILYEVVHFSCHLKENNLILNFPGLRKMREHHRLHHDPMLMGQYNFCIVFPLWDYLMGTKYKAKPN
ncbi:MAG: sterol desaturase family protein [Halobacteriovoraceae bacterium]|nr:sterol desaturase family protein [Halobacteriovoraceae bacterium]